MSPSRRSVIGAALPLAAVAGAAQAQAHAPAPSAVTASGGAPAQQAALERLRGYIEQHRAAWGLPGMTVVVVDARGFTGFITSGYADLELSRPIRPDDLVHIGSISKSFTALCIFKALQAGRLRLDDDVRQHLPGLPIAGDARVTLQALLNHSSGLPEDAPLFPRGGDGLLHLGYAPGAHWSYSNLGYTLLGMVAAKLGGATLEEVITREVFQPLGLEPQGARAALRDEDRNLYATGYYGAQMDEPLPRAGPLAQAPFETFTTGAGCVGMATPQMARYLRWLIAAGRGQGAPLLSDALAQQWTAPTVDAPGWGKPGDRYANGLAVVSVDGRTLLHHTGGMLAFSSSLHVDAEAGVACFASTNYTGFKGYRPRAITSWACGLFRTAAAGAATPEPPSVVPVPDSPDRYAGAFQSARGERLQVSVEQGRLRLAFPGGACELEPVDDDAFLAHAPRFARYAFLAEQAGGRTAALWWGATEYAAEPARPRGPAPAELAALAGRYDVESGAGVVRVVARPTGLFADGTTPLTRTPDGAWRPGKDDWTPERLRFDAQLEGRPQRLSLSGDDALRVADRTL